MAGKSKSPAKAANKKPAAKKPAAKAPSPKKPSVRKVLPKEPAVGKTPAAKSSSPKEPKAKVASKSGATKKPVGVKDQSTPTPAKPLSKTAQAFLERQRMKLLTLKDTLLDSMNGVARDSLRSRAEGNEASAFGMHQADAGSDAYDRDFALSLLSQEQDSLYEIDQALKRIDSGEYGVCEMCGKPIPHARLEALPFTRYTVECQAELEKRNRFQRVRQPVTSLFGLNDDDSDDSSDDDPDTKD